MKNTRKKSRLKQNKNDELYAKKVLCQVIVCIIIYIIVVANSKFSNSFSKSISDNIRHYLCVSVDFDNIIDTAKMYIENLTNKQFSVPVNSSGVMDSKEENR